MRYKACRARVSVYINHKPGDRRELSRAAEMFTKMLNDNLASNIPSNVPREVITLKAEIIKLIRNML